MDGTGSSSIAAGGSKSMKRKQVAVACFACQKRKSKCDGNRPQCQTCIKKGTDCAFDTDGDSRRTENLKRKVLALSMQGESDAATIKNYQTTIDCYSTILTSLKSSSQEATTDLIHFLQTATTLDEVLQHCEGDVSHSARDDVQGRATSASQHHPRMSVLEARISELEDYLEDLKTSPPERVLEQLQQISGQQDIESRAEFSPESALRKGRDKNPYLRIKRYLDSDRQARYEPISPYSTKSLRSERRNDMNFLLNPVVEVPKESEYESWTTVVDDGTVIQHLIDIYFTWYHYLGPVFSEDLFRQDIVQGRNQHCSRILVNAVLSLACYLPGQRGAGKYIKIKPETAVQFLHEAERLFLEAPEPSLMNIAALTIMATVEVQRCRFGPAWLHSRQASTMAIYLNLHQRPHNVDSTDQRNRCLTFWTVFQLDQFISAVFKRSPAFLLHNIGIDIPSDNTRFETKAWPGKAFQPELGPRPCMESRYMNFASRLSKIVNIVQDACHAAKYVYAPETILKIYKEYEVWHTELEEELPLETGSPPHIVALHMWYHSRVISLLKPILETELPPANINCLDVCRQAALSISHLYRCFINMFHLRGLHNQIGIAMLEACSVHVRFVQSSEYGSGEHGSKARKCLEQAVGTYSLLQSRFPSGGTIVHEITGLIQSAGINLEPDINFGPSENLHHPVNVDYVNRRPEKLEWEYPMESDAMEAERKPKTSNYDHFYKPRGT